MVDRKSMGVTQTERMLAEYCERSFLKLWSYANPYKDDGHELCDLLAVFENRVFIFFDREMTLDPTSDKDPQVLWDRWRRSAIDKQVKTAHGAERYLRSGRPVFLDAKAKSSFPVPINVDSAIFHKIIVAHGAKEACERASDSNVYGSIGISYSESEGSASFPFLVNVDRRAVVHIFDSHNLPIIFDELDTVYDFATYLDTKTAAVERYDVLSYAGEEDLLAHYFLNFDEVTKRHVIGSRDQSINVVMIGEGEWRDFVNSNTYAATGKANEDSYFWDELIQRTCENAINGTLTGNSELPRGPSAITEMAKEPRFMRRVLVAKIKEAVVEFPAATGGIQRKVTFLPSYHEGSAYVFLQLNAPPGFRSEPDYRQKRQTLLEIACGAAKNKFPLLKKVIGIAIDAPKYVRENSEDFILLPCEEWSEETRAHYAKANEGIEFFQSDSLVSKSLKATEFINT
jgi:hypothetical protein